MLFNFFHAYMDITEKLVENFQERDILVVLLNIKYKYYLQVKINSKL